MGNTINNYSNSISDVRGYLYGNGIVSIADPTPFYRPIKANMEVPEANYGNFLFRDLNLNNQQFNEMYGNGIFIGNGITDVNHLFYDTGSSAVRFMNVPVIFDENINISEMNTTFGSCVQFNQPVVIPKSVTRMFQTFFDCQSFNQPVILPNNVTYLYAVFYHCLEFNQAINIPYGVQYMNGLFEGCSKLMKSFLIPETVTDMVAAFYGTSSHLTRPIYICGNVDRDIKAQRLFSGVNLAATTPVIYCNSAIANHFLMNDSNSIIGKPAFVTPTGNGYQVMESSTSWNMALVFTNFSGRAEDVPPLN
jgi:hypothetical protein